MEPALPRLKEHTKSALNLLVLTIDREKGTPALLNYFHYFKPKEPEKVKYYKMFEGTMPGGTCPGLIHPHAARCRTQ